MFTNCTRALLAIALCAALPGLRAENLDTAMRIEKALPDAPLIKPEKAHKVLVYTRASGFVHGSIPVGAKAFEAIGKKTGAYEVTKITDDPAVFDPETLKEFDAIVLMSTTGEFLKINKPGDFDKKSDEDKKKIEADMKSATDNEMARRKALLDFVSSGKGLVGIHAAGDIYRNDPKVWPEIGELIGGYFNGHPWHNIVIKVDDPKSPLTAQFEGKPFFFNDEIYTYKTLPNHGRDKLHILLSVDLEASSELDKQTPPHKVDIKKDPATGKFSGENRADHDYAVAWIHKYGQGRVFYTLLGHENATFFNPVSMKFFLAGMQYALGDLKSDDAPSKPAGTETAPAK